MLMSLSCSAGGKLSGTESSTAQIKRKSVVCDERIYFTDIKGLWL